MASPEQLDFEVIEFAPVDVLRLMSMAGYQSAKETHLRLEGIVEEGGVDISKMTVYGIHNVIANTYFAAVQETDDTKYLSDLKHFTIPGGQYASVSMEDWQQRIREINTNFQRLRHSVGSAGSAEDSHRPRVEIYHDFQNLELLLPVTDGR